MFSRIFLIFSIILLIRETVGGSRDPCKPLWSTFQNGCYAFGEDALTWEEAKEECKKNRAHLVDIKSNMENNYVGSISSATTSDFWIGVKSKMCKDGQKWSLTSGEAATYTGWEPQQPNTASGDESCVRLDPVTMFNDVPVNGWKNINCNERLPYVCKYNRDPCEEGYSYFNGSCYTVEKKYMTWDNARLSCQDKNSELADINSDEETKFLTDLTYPIASVLYIGFTDACKDRIWKTADGTKANYVNWKPGQPDNYYNNEYCATIEPGSKGQWNDVACSTQYMSICKYTIAKEPPPQDDE